jgi:hypothetical protein
MLGRSMPAFLAISDALCSLIALPIAAQTLATSVFCSARFISAVNSPSPDSSDFSIIPSTRRHHRAREQGEATILWVEGGGDHRFAFSAIVTNPLIASGVSLN